MISQNGRLCRGKDHLMIQEVTGWGGASPALLQFILKGINWGSMRKTLTPSRGSTPSDLQLGSTYWRCYHLSHHSHTGGQASNSWTFRGDTLKLYTNHSIVQARWVFSTLTRITILMKEQKNKVGSEIGIDCIFSWDAFEMFWRIGTKGFK